MRRVALALLVSFVLAATGAAPVRADLEDVPYTVVRGDTGHRIARRFGLTLAELVALNDDRSLERLRPGDVLVVGRAHHHTHRVLPGETLERIASRWEVEPAHLSAWNALGRARALETGAELDV